MITLKTIDLHIWLLSLQFIKHYFLIDFYKVKIGGIIFVLCPSLVFTSFGICSFQLVSGFLCDIQQVAIISFHFSNYMLIFKIIFRLVSLSHPIKDMIVLYIYCCTCQCYEGNLLICTLHWPLSLLLLLLFSLVFCVVNIAKASEYAENHHEFEDSLNNQYNLTLLLSHLLVLNFWISDYIYVGSISSLFCRSLSSYCLFSFPCFFIYFWVRCLIFCIVVIVNSRQTDLTWNVGTSIENLPPSDNLWTYLWGSFLIGDWYRRAQHSVNCTFTEESVFCKKGSWSRTHERKKASRTTAWSLP